MSGLLLPLLMLCSRQEIPIAYDQYRAAATYIEAHRYDSELKFLDGNTDATLADKKKVKAYAEAVLPFIRKGNEIKVLFPQEKIGPDTLFPELASFKLIAKILNTYAYTLFADGQPRYATDVCLEVLRFSDRIRGRSLINGLVGIACQAITLRTLDRLHPSLGFIECQKLKKYVDSYLNAENRIIECLRAEHQYMLAIFESIENGSQEFLELFGTEEVNNHKLTKEEAKAAAKTAPAESEALFSKLLAVLKQPEAGWRQDEQEAKNPILQIIMPLYGQAFSAEAKVRTQFRILRAVCAVDEYRWTYDKLPAKLTDIGLKGLEEDPLSGKQLIYEKQTDSVFVVYSTGGLDLGRVDLTYRRAPGSTRNEDESIKP